MSFERGASCPPAVELERHSAGEECAARTHLEGCPSCAAQVRALQEASTEFSKRRPAELFLKQLERRRHHQPARRRWLWPGLGALAAASLAILVVPGLLTAGDEVRLKGGKVEVYFKRGQADPALLLDGALLKPGDTLRFRNRGAPAHLVLLERDEAESVTVFAPFGGTHSVKLGRDEFFAGAVTVDSTLGEAKLFVIHREAPFDVAPLVDAVRASRDPACDGCSVQVIRYQKVP